MELTLLERYGGALLGVHAGDSLAAPYEHQEPSVIAEDLARRGGLVPHEYPDPWKIAGVCPPGRPTDDSILTAALAHSLIEKGGNDPAHQYLCFKRAVNGTTSYLWGRETTTFGRTTRTMLLAANYARACARPDRPLGKSNGSIMRAAPLALWYHKRGRRQLERATQESSKVTHLHQAAIDSTVIYVRMLDRLLAGDEPEAAWRQARDLLIVSDPQLLELVTHQRVEKPTATNVWLRAENPSGLAGSAVHTLHIAVWATLYAKDFRSGITEAVLLGGDTDTQCAVAGGLLGAFHGIAAIPAEWQDVLKGRSRMLDLAYDLYRV